MNVLVLAAHPDDETLGCGATVAMLAQKDYFIKLITFTDGVGARKTVAANRNEKLEMVSKILGISEYVCGSFPDNKMDVVPLLEVCKFIEDNVDFEPDIIFTHHPDCLNVDHSIVYRATITAFRPQAGKKIQIYSYFVPSSTDYNPMANFNGNVYYNVEKFVDKKMEALKIYDEEMREHPHSRSYKNIVNLMKTAGAEVGIEYAEKFQLIRSIK